MDGRGARCKTLGKTDWMTVEVNIKDDCNMYVADKITGEGVDCGAQTKQ